MTEYKSGDRDAAFETLRGVVGDLKARGRQTLIQGVKPALQLATHREFDEQALGYRTFREFLDAAESAGAVFLVRTGSGLSVELAPGDVQGVLPARRAQVRPDLWRAVVDWSGSRTYWWDKSLNRMVSLGSEARPSNGLIQMPKLDRDTHRAWAREFLGHHASAHITSGLLAALDTDAGYEQFSRLIRADSRLSGEWQGERRRRVVGAIRDWAAKNEVDVDPYAPASESPRAISAVPPATVEMAEDVAVQRLRVAVKRAVDRMSGAELRQLQLPVGALEGSGL